MTKRKLPVPVGVFDQHIAVLGKTRSGKSSVMRFLVENLLDRYEPVCIIDPKGDWWGLRLSADGKSEGYPVVIFGGERADVAINEHVGADVAELVATGNRPSLIDFGGWTVGARTRFYNEFTSALFRHTRGDRWLVVDEIHNFAPKGTLRGEGGAMATSLHWTNRLASEGLGKGVHLIFASQRPQKVHNDTLTSAETLIAMRVLHPSDRGAISDWIKAAGDSSGAEVLETLAQLDRGEGWAWSPEIKFGPERIAFPLFSTYDSFRAQKADASKLKGWADVDLGEINTKLASVQEERKANDPRELRKEITELRKQLTAAQQVKPSSPARTVEKPVLKDVQLDRIEGWLGHLSGMEHRLAEQAAKVEERRQIVLYSVNAITRAIAAARAPQSEQSTKVHHAQRPMAVPAATVRKTAPRVPTADGDVKLNRLAERRVLQVLAQYGPRTLRQVAILAGYAMSGGGFKGAISKLRTLTLIAGNGSDLEITDGGRQAIGDVDPLPTGSALVAHWMQQFNRLAEREVLRVLVEVYPQSLTAEDVASRTNPPYEPQGGGFKGALSKLRTLGLIEGRGELKASDELFD